MTLKSLQMIVLSSLLTSQALTDNKLLYVFDIASHGSMVPQNLFIDPSFSQIQYSDKPGQVTPFGLRQMYLRGLEMRRRYIENRKDFMSSKPNPNEYYAFSIDEDPALVSAQAFMSGFFPYGLQDRLWDNQTVVAVPPIQVDKLEETLKSLDGYPLINNIQSIPIHSNAGADFDMIFNGYSAKTCPLIGDIQAYEYANNTDISEYFNSQYDKVYTILKSFKLLQVVKKGEYDKIYQLIQEIKTNENEQLNKAYTISDEDMQVLNKYQADIMSMIKYKNTTVQQIISQDLFKYLQLTFDGKIKAQLGTLEKEYGYLQLQKFWHLSTNIDQILALYSALNLNEQKQLSPDFSSSIILEFYAKGITPAPTEFNRANYFIKIYVNDEAVKPNQLDCNEQFECSYDSLVKYFESMTFKDVITEQNIQSLQQFCFTQLNYQHVTPKNPNDEPGGLPWWLALVIAIPLVIITVAIIKIVMIVKEKRRRKLEEQLAMYNRLTPASNTQSMANNNGVSKNPNHRMSVNTEEDSEHNSTI